SRSGAWPGRSRRSSASRSRTHFGSPRMGESNGDSALDPPSLGGETLTSDRSTRRELSTCLTRRPLELIEVRAAGFGMPKLKDGETAVIGHLGYEVDDLEDAKAELTRRGGGL